MTDTHKAMLVMTTVDSAELAATMATALVEQRLAACVQEMPIRSHYRWEGSVQNDVETLLFVKTSPQSAAAAMDAIRKLHPYDVPEIIALPVTDGLPAYLDWIRTEAVGGSEP